MLMELKKINQAGRKSAWKVQGLERAWGEQGRQGVRRNTGMIKVPPPLQAPRPPALPHSLSSLQINVLLISDESLKIK